MKAALPTRASQALQVAVMFACSDGGVMFVGIKRRRLAVGEKFASVQLCALFESDVCRFRCCITREKQAGVWSTSEATSERKVSSLQARSQICEKRLLASSCLFVHMKQRGSHWTDFHEILYLNIYRIFVEKIQVSLKSGKNNGYFARIPMYVFSHLSPSSS